jgi:hypothetical protein
MIKRMLVVAAATILPVSAPAQTLTGIKVEPTQIPAGETVKVTVSFDVEGGVINCGLRIHFGDGNTVDYKINQKKDVPLVVPRAYGTAGDYRIMAEPKTVMPIMKCFGKNQTTTLKVAAAGAAPAEKGGKPGKAAKASPQCPAGWTLDRKSVKKSGAYTCRAASGAPAVKLACPADLDYFENTKKGTIGCRP